MKDTLQVGLRYEHAFVIPSSKTVPALYPEAPEFVEMPEVFATGFMVGFLEWACILCIKPHLDWPAEQSLGTHISVSHEAATPPGMTVTATVEITAIEGRRITFSVSAHDGVDTIARGTHERFVIDRARFENKLRSKQTGGAR